MSHCQIHLSKIPYLEENDAFACDTTSRTVSTAHTANAARAIPGHWIRMTMRSLQRTSQCQRSLCCLLAVCEHLPLLILEPLLRHLLRLCLLRVLLRHLFRLCLLRLLLMHLLKVLLLRLLKRPDRKTFLHSNHGSQCPAYRLHCQLPPAVLQEPTTTSSPTESETKKHKQQHEEDDDDKDMDSFHPLQPTDPLCFLYLRHNQLLHRILRQADQEVGLTVKCPKPLLFNILIHLLIRHVTLDKRNLLFLNLLLHHQIRHREVLPEFYSDIAKAHG